MTRITENDIELWEIEALGWVQIVRDNNADDHLDSWFSYMKKGMGNDYKLT